MRDQKLIERYVDLDTDHYPGGKADARLRTYGVSVWALIGHLRVVDNSMDRVAEDYGLPTEAVEAALAYYRQYGRLIDARLLLNTA